MDPELSLLEKIVATGEWNYGLWLVVVILVRAWIKTLRMLDIARQEEIARLSRWVECVLATRSNLDGAGPNTKRYNKES
jgi:hypothetical protein